MDAVNEYLVRHRVPTSLTRRIRDYYDYMFAARHAFGEQQLLHDLPRSLQIRLNVSMNHHRIRKIPIFNNVPDECVLAIIEKLKSVITIPGEYIVNSGEWGTNLYIIENGRVCLTIPKSGRRFSFTGTNANVQSHTKVAKAKEKKHLEYLGWRVELVRMKHRKWGELVVKDLVAGDFFGEEALFHEVESLSARSVTYCDLLYLATTDMELVAREFPTLASSLESEMANREQERAMVDKQERQRLQRRRSSGSGQKRIIGGNTNIESSSFDSNSSKYQVSSPSPDNGESKQSDQSTKNVASSSKSSSLDKSRYNVEELSKRVDLMDEKIDKILQLLSMRKGNIMDEHSDSEDVN